LFVVGCWLFVVCCLLFVVCCWLLVVCCLLFVVCCLLFVVCWLLVVGCWLLVVGCWLLLLLLLPLQLFLSLVVAQKRQIGVVFTFFLRLSEQRTPQIPMFFAPRKPQTTVFTMFSGTGRKNHGIA